jgi:hypothetical protein
MKQDAYTPTAPQAGVAAQTSAPRGQQRCGNIKCGSGRLKRWRGRNRAHFEDAWTCSAACMRASVMKSIRRELGQLAETASPHRHRVPLGLVLLAQGLVTHPQLQQALQAQRHAGTGKIGDWLTREFGVGEEAIMRALGLQWNCPVLSAEGFEPEAMALTLPRILVEKNGMVPLRSAGAGLLYMAFADQKDSSAAFALARMHDLRVESGLTSSSFYHAARERLLECTYAPATLAEVADVERLAGAVATLIEKAQPFSARLVRVYGHFWLRMRLEWSATHALPRHAEEVEDHIWSIANLQLKSGD